MSASLAMRDPRVLCVDVEKLFGRQIVGAKRTAVQCFRITGTPAEDSDFLDREGEPSKLTAKHTAG